MSVADTDTGAGTPAEGSAQKTSRAGRNLPVAITVGALLGGAVIASLVYAPHAFVGIVAAGVLLGTLEVVRRLRAAGYVIPVIPLVVGGQATLWLTWPFGVRGALAGFGATVVVCMIWRLLSPHGRRAAPVPDASPANYLRDVSATVFLAAWVPLFASFAALLVYPQDGPGRAFALAIGVVASDVGGYAAGVLFGKHPMVPAISPKKSWEGLVGSLVFGVTATALTVTYLGGKPWWIGVLLGFMLVATATLGDLVESQVKRDLGIKDMGSLLPGHGGVMDRFDGFLPSAVAAWVVLTLVP
ncbi:phosphatidate cytidylyltransferase [Mycobacterium celatum]|uniref:Phosphatidate cytidylyltransferase n=2 Tax=Mycobacterium celatum TaxID=28045 RepID=A0A1X1RNL2_MYCCE|nr:phosphatidate cytidylyltransferase [Mycobacterium celatum]ORV10362.1 phosphatidate cytidylyltransferase [Mycobacterium celatum]PIB78969.1 phosphatidate cytidylyltransferase [Mycobacterium celatum]